MMSRKTIAALALSFSAVAGCATGGSRVQTRPETDGVSAKLDFICKSQMTRKEESEACREAALNAEESFNQKLAAVIGDDADVNYELWGRLNNARESEFCRKAYHAINDWAINVNSARAGSIEGNGMVFSSMYNYFAARSRCLDEYRQIFAGAGNEAMASEVNGLSQQASGLAGAMAHRYRRGLHR